MQTEDVSKIAAKVAALLAKADDPAATPAEKVAFAEKAAELMVKYEIDSMTLDAGKDGELPIVFGQFRLYAEDDDLIPDERIGLAGVVAENFECRIVIHRMKYASIDAEDGRALKPGTYAECVGYKADFEFMQLLYVNLGIDLLSRVLAETTTIMGSLPKMTAAKKKAAVRTYQRNFAQAYVSRISQRLEQMYGRVKHWDGEMSDSVGLALRSRLQQVQDKFNEKYPPGSLGTLRVSRLDYDHNARARGAAAANQADIGGGKLHGAGNGGQIGQARKEVGRG